MLQGDYAICTYLVPLFRVAMLDTPLIQHICDFSKIKLEIRLSMVSNQLICPGREVVVRVRCFSTHHVEIVKILTVFLHIVDGTLCMGSWISSESHIICMLRLTRRRATKKTEI